MTVTTRGGKQTMDLPMPTKVEIVVERDQYEIEVTQETKDATQQEAWVTQEVVLIPRPLSPLPQRLVKKTEERKYRRFITMLKNFPLMFHLYELWRKFVGVQSL